MASHSERISPRVAGSIKALGQADVDAIRATALGLPTSWVTCELRHPPGQLAIMPRSDRALRDARWIADPESRMITGTGGFKPYTYDPPFAA